MAKFSCGSSSVLAEDDALIGFEWALTLAQSYPHVADPDDRAAGIAMGC